jgi:hypothetical protein
VQAVRIRANGTQNYRCQQIVIPTQPNDSDSKKSTTTKMAWVLRYPLAHLWLYSVVNETVNTNRAPDGVHYSVGAPDDSAVGFANMVWDIGTNCDYGNPLKNVPPSCSTYQARWRGKNPISDPKVGAISYLRLEKDETKMDPTIGYASEDASTSSTDQGTYYYNAFWQFSFIQRLRTVGGLVSTANVPCGTPDDINNTVTSPFQSDFVLSLKEVRFPTGVYDTIKLPDGCFQALAFSAEGRMDYEQHENSTTWRPVVEQQQQDQPIFEAILRAYSTEEYDTKFDNGTTTDNTQQQNHLSMFMTVIPGVEGLVGIHYTTTNTTTTTNKTSADSIRDSIENTTATKRDLRIGFKVGGDCFSAGGCRQLSGLWEGMLTSTEPNGDDNIPLGLGMKSTDVNTSTYGIRNNVLAPYGFVQQLLTDGGVAPSTFIINWTAEDDQVVYNSSEYNCTFVFALCARQVTTSNDMSSSKRHSLHIDRFLWTLGIIVLMLVLI